MRTKNTAHGQIRQKSADFKKHNNQRYLALFGLDLSHNVYFRPKQCKQQESILALSIPIAPPRGPNGAKT
jgi:hypothetical protein